MAKYYYNGVLLPEIPAEVLAEYPYAWIHTDHTKLYVAKAPWSYRGNNYISFGSVTAENRAYKLSKSGEEWELTHTFTDNGGYTPYLFWSNHDIYHKDSTEIYFYGSEPVDPNAPEEPDEPEVPIRTSGYLIRSGDSLFTVAEGHLTAVEGSVNADLFKSYGIDNIPDGALLATLTDPEVLYWQDSTDELPTLSLTVKGTPPLPQMFTSEPMNLVHESIAGISHAAVDASEDVRFAISFDGGTTWKAFDGSAWFDISDTVPGMLPSTMNAITAEQWAEVVVLESYMVRFWLPNVTAYVKSAVMHYINP